MAFKLPISTLTNPTRTKITWTRPADWPSITKTTNEVKFLVSNIGAAFYSISTVFTKNSGTNLYIDWGDGTTDTISTATATTTTHTYTSGGTPCTRGYNTFVVRIYTDSTSVINNCKFITPPAKTSFPNTTTATLSLLGVLEAYFGNGTMTDSSAFAATYYSGNVATAVPSIPYLENVEMPDTLTGPTNCFQAFQNCVGLRRFVFPQNTGTATNFGNFLANCWNVYDITLWTTTGASLTNMSQIFTNNYSQCNPLDFTGVSLANITTLNNAFAQNYNQTSITLPTMTACLDYTQAFGNCTALINFTIAGMAQSGTINATSMFTSCNSLANVTFPNTIGGSALINGTSIFTSCSSILSIKLPTDWNPTTMAGAFSGCSALLYISMPTSMPNCTSWSTAFTSCPNLQSIAIPTSSTAGYTINGAFNFCRSLTSITFGNSAFITGSLQNSFQNCNSVITLDLTGATGITILTGAFINCFNLKTITLPSSLSSCTALDSAFSSCYALQSLTFPSTMNAVTTMTSMCINCYQLTSVTLPTSMSSLVNYSSSFNNCVSLKTLTMPATTNTNVSSVNTAFSGCSSLISLTLPTTQSNAISAMTNMIGSCSSLTSITNTDKLGSNSTTGTIVAGTNFSLGSELLTGTLTFSCRLSVLFVGSGVSTIYSNLTGLRLTNTGSGQWGGISPQIDINRTNIGYTNLVTLFNDIAAQGTVTSKTINITNCAGAASLTASDRLIITSKGWTITG